MRGEPPIVAERPEPLAGRRLSILPFVASVMLLAAGCAPAATSASGGSDSGVSGARPAPSPLPARLTPAPNVAGNPAEGRRLYVATGCAGCHTLQGVPAATGVAGPNLTNVVVRPTLAGETLPMTPETMARWLREPAALKPGTPMPDVGLTEQEAREITAFLYSQPYNPGR